MKMIMANKGKKSELCNERQGNYDFLEQKKNFFSLEIDSSSTENLLIFFSLLVTKGKEKSVKMDESEKF